MRIARLPILLIIFAGATCVASSVSARVSAFGCSLWNDDTDRYEVADESDLDTLRSSPTCLTRTVVQTAHIDLAILNGSDWTPINNFAGVYDGNDKSITGLTLSGSDAGLFNTTHSTVTVENLTVVVDPTSVAMDRVGSIIGSALGPVTIENVSVIADFSANYFVGGLIGLAREDVTISRTSVSGEIDASFSVGGMVGRSEMDDLNTITIDDSRATVDVAVSGSFAGGVFGVGLDTHLVIDDSSVEASVTSGTSSGGYAGGFAGGSGDVDITDSSASGEVHSGSSGVAGGFVAALIGDSRVRRSFWDGSVSSDAYQTGGFFGFSDDVTVEDSYCLGEITSTTTAAGFVSDVSGFLEIERSFSGCDSSAQVSGGFFTEAAGDVTISNSYVTGASSGDVYLGGFGLGIGGDLSITDSYVTSTLTGAAAKSKFVLETYGSSSITNSFCIDSDCPSESLITLEELASSTFLVDRTWDFRDVWCIESSLNGGFPVLRTIDFGPSDSNNCGERRSGSTTRTVTLDPAGGECDGTSTPWTRSFRRSYTLPTASDCTRDGYVFLGWSHDSSLSSPEDLLTGVTLRSANLTAVWGALPAAPSRVDVIANFLCRQDCTSAIITWPQSTDSTGSSIVSVDDSDSTCVLSGEVFGLEWCWITGLASGTTHTASVFWRNRYGSGPAVSASFSLD